MNKKSNWFYYYLLIKVKGGGGGDGDDPRVTVNIVSRIVGNGNGNQDVTAGTRTRAQATSTNYLRISNYYQIMQMRENMRKTAGCFSLFTYLTGVRCPDIRCSTLGDNICITIRLVISTQIARLARE